MKTILTVIVIVVLGGAIAFFAFQNPETISISLYKTELEASKGLIFLACALAGFILAILLFLPTWVSQKLKLASLGMKISKLNKMVSKKDVTISKKDAAIGAKDDALDELSDEIEKREKIELIKNAFIPGKK